MCFYAKTATSASQDGLIALVPPIATNLGFEKFTFRRMRLGSEGESSGRQRPCYVLQRRVGIRDSTIGIGTDAEQLVRFSQCQVTPVIVPSGSQLDPARRN